MATGALPKEAPTSTMRRIVGGGGFTNAAGQEAPTSISWGGMPDLAAYYNVYCA